MTTVASELNGLRARHAALEATATESANRSLVGVHLAMSEVEDMHASHRRLVDEHQRLGRYLHAHAAAITSDETNEQSVMMVCVIVRLETR